MKPSVRNPPRNGGYFLHSARAFSIEKCNFSRSGYLSKFEHLLHLPRKVTLQHRQILHLPRKVALVLHQIFFTLLFSCSILLFLYYSLALLFSCSIILYSTSLTLLTLLVSYSIILYSTSLLLYYSLIR